METTATAKKRGRPKNKVPLEQMNVLLPVPVKKQFKQTASGLDLSAGKFVEELYDNYRRNPFAMSNHSKKTE